MLNRSRKKMPRDVNQLAKAIVDASTSENEDTLAQTIPEKNPAAVALGKLGGKVGGKARAAALTPERRKEISLKASQARWGSKP